MQHLSLKYIPRTTRAMQRDQYHATTGHTDITFIAVSREIEVNYERVAERLVPCTCMVVYVCYLKFLDGVPRMAVDDSRLYPQTGIIYRQVSYVLKEIIAVLCLK